jgi:hypothetical protein
MALGHLAKSGYGCASAGLAARRHLAHDPPLSIGRFKGGVCRGNS